MPAKSITLHQPGYVSALDAYGVSDTSPERVYRRDDVAELTGFHPDYIRQLVREKKFPRPIRLGERAVGWLQSDIVRWQRQRIAERDGKAA